MELKPQKPIREFRFKIIARYDNGEEKEVVLDQTQDIEMRKYLDPMATFIHPERPISEIIITIGDRQELRPAPEDNPPQTDAGPGLNTAADIKGEPDEIL